MFYYGSPAAFCGIAKTASPFVVERFTDRPIKPHRCSLEPFTTNRTFRPKKRTHKRESSLVGTPCQANHPPRARRLEDERLIGALGADGA